MAWTIDYVRVGPKFVCVSNVVPKSCPMDNVTIAYYLDYSPIYMNT